MKNAPLLLVAILVAVVQFGTPVSGQQGQVRRAARAIPNQYIVVLSGTDDPLAVGLQSQQIFSGRLRHVYQSALRGFSIRMTAAAAQALARDPRVDYVEEDGLAQINDVQPFPPAWGLDRIDQRQRPLDNSYSYPPPAAQVHVHVLDTGILPTHVEFGGRANVAGDFIDDDGDNDPNDIGNDDATPGVPDGIDCHGHGTHVAATIAGATYGVAKDALVHGYRVLNCAGSGPISGIVAGIDAVVADGRRPAVANMSLGGSPSTTLDNAVRSAIAAGITFVVAAGNDAVDASLESPSRVAEAITVGATDVNDNKPGFSNYGSVLDVFAPGVSILSAFIGSNTATATMSGTSMASPHVAGVAALYLEQNGNKTPQQVRDALVAAATTGVLSNIGSGSPNRLLYSAFVIPPVGGRINVAAAVNGGVATASSTYSAGYPATAVTNGERRGAPYGGGGTWSDGTGYAYPVPDWVQIDFAGAKAIDEVDVFGLQDNYSSPVDPTPALTCTRCPVDFTVQYWTGASWDAVPNGIVRNNTLVWRTISFAPITTSRIRVLVERSLTGWSEVAEVEAYGTSNGPVNTPPTVSLTSPAEGTSKVAPASFTLTAQAGDIEGPVTKVQFFNGTTMLNEDTTSPFTFDWTNVGVGNYTLTAVAFDGGGLSTTSAAVHVSVTSAGGGGRVNVAAGGVATASSTYSAGYPATAVINGERRGAPYGGGGTWSDGTGYAFPVPDWVQIDFAGAKTIDEVDVFGLQDNYASPVDPTPALTCTRCPVDFTVQYWTGASWDAVPNGIVRNNTLVWRTISFAPITTSRIRVLVERSLTGWSEVAEVEAYGTSNGPVNTPPTVSLTSPAEGASKVAPASFTLTAQAGDVEGPVTKVQFFNGTTMLNEDTTSPFTFDWTNVGVGNYTLTAVAFDGGGLSTTSAAVHVTVTTPGGGSRVNVAAGGVATASSTYSAGYPASAVINGERRGAPYGGGGTWSDGTGYAYPVPDWVQIDFAGAKAIDEVDVFGLQDNYTSPVDPTPALTCTRCPVDFTVQYWTGASWDAVPNGIVRNNTLVWRTISFAPITTSRIRVLVERSITGWSEVAEVEAYGTDPVP